MSEADETSSGTENNVLPEMSASSVVTAARVRPLTKGEYKAGYRDVIGSIGNDAKNIELNVLDPTFFSRKRDYERQYFERTFKYDFAFPMDSTQEEVYDNIGKPLLKHCMDGFNCALLVYGQTGSGKTYTILGDQGDRSDSSCIKLDQLNHEDGKGIKEDLMKDKDDDASIKSGSLSSSSSIDSREEALQGIVPRLCQGLLTALHESKEDSANFGVDQHSIAYFEGRQPEKLDSTKVLVSFYEIYNEKVFDLLSKTPNMTCKVREHPQDGAFVDELNKFEVKSLDDCEALIEIGLKQRSVAETKMNQYSSRSHAIFTLYVEQKFQSNNSNAFGRSGKVNSAKEKSYIDRNGKITLVDLAGSERVSLTGATGDRLTEANNINRSLSTLSDVIKALSDKGAQVMREKERELALMVEGKDPTASKKTTENLGMIYNSSTYFIPYRNSVLTWLLKDCLGGNARTSMLANVSPSEANYNETMSTLRYIERAKLIVNTARINETSTDPAFVLSLQKTVAALQQKIMILNRSRTVQDRELQAALLQQEESLEKEFVTRTQDMKEQIRYYEQSRSVLMSTHSPRDVKQTRDNEHVKLLEQEVADLKEVLNQKKMIIDEYEQKFNTSFSSSPRSPQDSVATHAKTPGSVVTFALDTAPSTIDTALSVDDDNATKNLGMEMANTIVSSTSQNRNVLESPVRLNSNEDNNASRMKSLITSYKREKDILSHQYETLLIRMRKIGTDLDTQKLFSEKLESQKDTVRADLQVMRADRNRIRSDLTAVKEELSSKQDEVDYYKSKVINISNEHKKKEHQLEQQLSRLREGELGLKDEKQREHAKFEELLSENRRLNDEVEGRLDSQRAEMQLTIDDIEKYNKKLTKDLEKVLQDVQKKDNAIKSQDDQLQEMKQSVSSLQEKLQAEEVFHLEMNEKNKELTSTKYELNLKADRVQALSEELDEAKRKKDSLRDELKKLNKKYEDDEGDKQEQIDALNREISETKTQVENLLRDKDDRDNTIFDLKKEVKKHEDHARAVEGESVVKAGGLYKQIDEIRQELKEKEDELNKVEREHQGELDDLNAKLTKKSQKVESLQKEVQQEKNEGKTLRNEKSDLQTALEREQSNLTKMTKKFEDTDESLREKEKEISSMKGTITKLENEKKKQSVELETITKKYQKAEETADKEEEEIHNLEDKIKSEEEQLAQLQKHDSEVSDQLKQVSSQLEMKTTECQETMDALERERHEKQQKVDMIASLEKSIQDYSSQIEDEKQESLRNNDTAKERINDLEQQVKNLQLSLQEQTDKAQALDTQKHELEDELYKEEEHLHQVEKQVHDLEDEVKEKATLLEEDEKKIEDLEDELEDEKMEHIQEHDDNEVVIEKLQKQVKYLEKKLEAANDDLQSADTLVKKTIVKHKEAEQAHEETKKQFMMSTKPGSMPVMSEENSEGSAKLKAELSNHAAQLLERERNLKQALLDLDEMRNRAESAEEAHEKSREAHAKTKEALLQLRRSEKRAPQAANRSKKHIGFATSDSNDIYDSPNEEDGSSTSSSPMASPLRKKSSRSTMASTGEEDDNNKANDNESSLLVQLAEKDEKLQAVLKELEELKETVQEEEEELDEYEEETKELEKDLAIAEEEVKDLTQQLQDSVKTQEESRATLVQAMSTIDELKAKVAQLEIVTDPSGSDKKEKSKSIAKKSWNAIKSLTGSGKKSKDKEAAVMTTTTDDKALEEEKEKSRKISFELQEFKDRLELSEAAGETLTTQVSELQSQLTQALEKERQQRLELEKEREQRLDLESHHDSYSQKKSDHEKMAEEYQGTIKSLHEEVSSMNAIVTEKNEKVTELEQELSCSITKVKQLETELRSKATELEEVKIELELSKDAYENASPRSEGQESAQSQASRDLESITEELILTKTNLASLQQEYEILDDSLRQEKRGSDELKEILSAMRMQIDSQKREASSHSFF